MLPRRALLKQILGAGVAATTVKPSDIAAAANKVGLGGGVVGKLAKKEDTPYPSRNSPTGRLLDDMHTANFASKSSVEHMDVDIRTKKSWSEAYKSVVHTERERPFQDIRRALETNEAFANKVLKLLGKAGGL